MALARDYPAYPAFWASFPILVPSEPQHGISRAASAHQSKPAFAHSVFRFVAFSVPCVVMRTVNVRIIRRTRQLVRFETLVIALNEPNHLEIRRVSPAPSATQFWKRPEYFTALMILFFVNMADRTFGPIIPLFLEELGTPRVRLEMVSGIVISAAAFGEAFSAWLSGRLASRVTLRRLIIARLLLSVVVLVPMVIVHSTTEFSMLRIALALLAGGTLTLALSTAHHVIPGQHRGTGFAMLSGTSMLGGAAGPIISGSLAGLSIRSIFVFNSVVYLLVTGFVYRNVKH